MPRLRPSVETELGTEIQCAKCGEFWPAEKDFFYFHKGRPHSWCKDCYSNDPKIIAKNLRHKQLAAARYEAKKQKDSNHANHPKPA
ncbi:hypothetical protein [Pseudogulbenkiania ferrooxidans]|uniref:Uncharacterized protein n=1 Tax=Pseudogulbenkiania ferrooxidans 2002 TaxID=279714 RepID=B9Z4W9_9NEIS|nr:hypothetical protein [Pseudogulbenkiania ferrooxidans]EEG08201.1 conserved hypothetical protein [Pseudogulbenkiania ferrooxidans 2002]